MTAEAGRALPPEGGTTRANTTTLLLLVRRTRERSRHATASSFRGLIILRFVVLLEP
jgi:hypothetical protein